MQVGAAVRPAFARDTASHVTAAACDLCSAWLGCGVARDIDDLRRVHQLLVSSLDKLNKKGNTTLIYNESMATLEKLSILKAWAEVYIVAMVSNDSAPGSYVRQLDTKPFNNKAELAKWRNKVLQNNNQIDNATQEEDDEEYGDFESKGESLLKLVEPELESLGDNWLAALKDHALLSLPPEFASQLPHGGGAFYSAETAEASRAHYVRAWPSLLYAAALRYNANFRDIPSTNSDDNQNTDNTVDNRSNKTENGNFEFFEPVDERFHLLFGICMEALCAQRDMSDNDTVSVLLALVTLLDAPENRARLLKDSPLKQEGKVGVIGVPKGLGVNGDTLLVKSLTAMSELTSLTSPQGALSLLPTILYLATEVLKESKGEPVVSEAGILLLQHCAECKRAALLPDTKERHAQLLQSALAKLVESVKTEAAEQRMEAITGARGMAAVLGRAAPAPALHYPCINHFRQCLDTRDNDAFAACCGVLRGVWGGGGGGGGSSAVSWWARALGARVVARAAAARRPADASHVRAALAALAALDDLLAAAPNAPRVQLLRMLVPIVISYLRESGELVRAAPHERTLHDFALNWLMRVGPKYPQEFKTMMQQSPELRSKLEGAVKASQSARAGRTPPRPVFESRPARPTIQLKTDFSDFR
ncbi:HEAT repeat-containing protein 5B [Papilio machaon]|uniref:HEAT repeat-containing protein 5B n=1 Tax=Papilio machaon TaxID=76193 RepID=A0A194RKI8_PAPMA|nr:HEAT repeat-containing protein 5B [Papilio machaon]